MPAQRFDIFCKVVDNYGDAGVCWRLARQLVREHGTAVTLWIDALGSLVRIAPDLHPARQDQTHADVRVRVWGEPFPAVELPDVVVEGFGCGLPHRYIEAMVAAPWAPVWINLEYLSAEPWVESAHALPSPQPLLPLTRHFFFPGFTEATGGLLREAGLLAARDAAQAQRAERVSMLRALVGSSTADNALAVSMFCYSNPALPALLDIWVEGDEPVVCLVPEGVAAAALDAWTGGAVPHARQSLVHGPLTLTMLPFVAQDDYDRVLWQCDANFVRGEDSFVRAQWAARPFAWHIYPQADDTHRVKLDEFLRRFQAGMDKGLADSLTRFWHAWNDGDGPATAAAWPEFRAAFPLLARRGKAWSRRLAELPDLATRLVRFAEDRL